LDGWTIIKTSYMELNWRKTEKRRILKGPKIKGLEKGLFRWNLYRRKAYQGGF